MTCTVCGKPAHIMISDDVSCIIICDTCAKAINEEIQANMEDK